MTEFIGRVSEIPYLTKDNKMQGFSVNGIKIFTSSGRKIYYGDLVKITHKGNKAPLFFPQITIIEMASKNPLLKIINETRNNFQNNFNKAFQNSNESLPASASSQTMQAGQLLSGIVLGNSKGFSTELWQKLKNTGVLHIAAASGMNIVIVTKMTAPLWGFGGFWGIIFGQIITAWFYAFLSGGSGSVVRAATMVSFSALGKMFGRPNGAAMGLFWAIIFMLFWNPSYIFDIGFQLSVAATAGIILINNSHITHKPHETYVNKIKQNLKSSLDTTLAATLATAPLVWWHFGTIAWIGVVVNFLAVWTVDFVMILGLLIGIFGPWGIFVWPTEALLKYFLWIVETLN